MKSYTKRHRIWLKAIATVVVCLFVLNDLAFALEPSKIDCYKLSAYSRFSHPIRLEGKGLEEDAGFIYLSHRIGQALKIEKEIKKEIDPEVIKYLARKELQNINFTRFRWEEIYRDGSAFCLPYARKDDGRIQILKFFHPDDISAEFPHKILFQFEDGTKVILEDPLKDEGEGSSEFSLELDQMAADIAAGRDEKFKRVPDEELPPRIKKGMGKPSLTIRGVYEYTGGKLGLRVLKKGVRNIDVLKGFFRTRSRWRCPTFFRDHDDEHVYELDLLPLGYRNLKDIAGEYAENLPSGWREKIRQAVASALRRDGEWFGHGHMHSGNIMVKTDEAGDLVDIKLIDWKQLRRQKIREELKEFIEGSRQSLEGLYFEGFALEGLDFRGRNLTSASFLACNLNWTDFRGANLELTRMRFSDLRNADFTGARFSGSDLEATMFGGADLTDADLKSCKLSGALFAGANLDHTDFRGSFLDGVAWENALMKNTKFDKYMGEKLEKYRFQVKYIEDYCEATSPDLDVTRLEGLVRGAAIGSIPEFRVKQVAGYFLPYKEMDDDFLIKAIRKCLYEDPYFSISNFDLESKEREALREGIPLIVNEAKDGVVVKTYGIGRKAVDLQRVVKMLIDHLEECGKKINIRLIGYDVSERSLLFSRDNMKRFIKSLPAAWRERISYEVYYGDLTERKCWPLMVADPPSDISIKRHTWIHLERDPLSNLREERDLEDALEKGLNAPGVLIVNEAARMVLKVKKTDDLPPPGSPATLLRYMFGYNFKKEKYEAGKAINKKRAKRVVQLVGKRGGNDSPSTVSIEMRVLREAGLIESYRVNKSGQIFYFLPEWVLELDPEEILAKVPELEETNPIAKISKIKGKITHLKRKVVKEAGLSESEEGEAVINTETHSAGMKDRPVISIMTTLWKVYRMFPDLKITFKWRKSQISITEAPSVSDFSPLRDISYKGKMKIIIAGPYPRGTLNKIAALLEKLIHEEKFRQGFSPDGRVIEGNYNMYTGAMLKDEIDTDIKALGMFSTNFGWPKSPPGNPMTLLQYMFGYDFKEGRLVPENLIGRNNPKKAADMVGKRGGKDSPATIRLEVKVLREAGLIEGNGRKGYYIPEWVIEYGLDRVMAEIEELNIPKPKEKQMEAIKDKVDRIKAQISMEEVGAAKLKGPEKKKKRDPAKRRAELVEKLRDLKSKLPKGIEATVDTLAEVSGGKLTPQQILLEVEELKIVLAALGITTRVMPEREKWVRRLRALLLKLPKGAEPTERALAKASKGELTAKQIGEVLHDHNITLEEIGAAGMHEVILEAETHSGGIHHRPTEALVYICVRLQDILPVAEIIFIGSDETVRIKNPRTTAACFDPLRRLGEKEKGRYVYRGKIKIIVSGAYPEGELRKAASILEILIGDERFTYGIEPDVYTEGPDGKQYTGAMLKIEIDKKLNELEALKKSRLADLARKTQLLDTTIPKTLADLEREMRINNRCITFYWKEMSGHSKLRPGNELRQALTEVTSIGDELDQLLNVVQTRRDTGKGLNIGSRKEIFDLVREINESASGFHFAITYLLMSGPKSYVAQNLVSKLENIMEICGQILPGEGAEEREEEELEEEEAPVIPQKVSKEPEASRRKRDEALPPIRDELVSAKFTLVDILTSAELFVDKDRETELVRDVISTKNKKFLKELISLLEDLKKNREKITKNILIEAGEIRKAAERCREPFETIIKVSSSAGVGKGNIFYIRLVKMAEMLAKIKALCDDIAPPKKKAPPDGSPYKIFDILRTNFKGKFVSSENVQRQTKGRAKDGHLSLDEVRRDLGTLMYLELIERSKDGEKYRALEQSPDDRERIDRYLRAAGPRPNREEKSILFSLLSRDRAHHLKAGRSDANAKALYLLLREFFAAVEKGSASEDTVRKIKATAAKSKNSELEKILDILLGYYGDMHELRRSQDVHSEYDYVIDWLRGYFADNELYIARWVALVNGEIVEKIYFGKPEYFISVDHGELGKIVFVNITDIYLIRGDAAGLDLGGQTPGDKGRDVYVFFGPKLEDIGHETLEQTMPPAIHEAHHKFIKRRLYDKHLDFIKTMLFTEVMSLLATYSLLEDKRLIKTELLTIISQSMDVENNPSQDPHLYACSEVERAVIIPAFQEPGEDEEAARVRCVKMLVDDTAELSDEIAERIRHFAKHELDKIYRILFGCELDFPDITSLPIKKIGKTTPDGAPYSIFEILRTKFEGEFVSAENVRKFTEGRMEDGHLSIETVKRDLGTLVYLGLVDKDGKGDDAIFRAADLSPPEWEIVGSVLKKDLGSRPTSKQKKSAKRKLSNLAVKVFEKANCLRKGDTVIPFMVSNDHNDVVEWITWLQEGKFANKRTQIINFDFHGDTRPFASNIVPRPGIANWLRWLIEQKISTRRHVWVHSQDDIKIDPREIYSVMPGIDEYACYGRGNVFSSVERMKGKIKGLAIITIDFDYIAPKERGSITDEEIERRVNEIADAITSANIVPVAVNFTYSDYKAPKPNYLIPGSKKRIARAFLAALKKRGFVFGVEKPGSLKKVHPDGAPYSIFNKLQIKFKGRYATTEEVRKLTKGRYKDGHLSPDVVEEDLKTLVFLGLVKRSDDGNKYKALDVSPSEWEEVSRVLLDLGPRPKKKQKEAAAKKLAEMFSRKARESALAEETPVEKDIREYSLKYGSDDPFMILGVALTKVNWPVVRYYVYYLSELVKKGRPMSVLQEHILLRAEHALEEYRKKMQALDDWVRDEGKPPAEGSPYRIFEILRTNFKGRFVTAEEVRKLTKGRHKDGYLSLEVVKRDLGTLVYAGLVRKQGKGKKAVYGSTVDDKRTAKALEKELSRLKAHTSSEVVKEVAKRVVGAYGGRISQEAYFSATDCKIVDAIEALQKAKAGGLTLVKIAEKSGIHKTTITRRKRDNPSLGKVLGDALASSAKKKILAAVERIKEKGETATGREIAEEAGVHIGTVARLKAESDEVRKAVDSVSLSAKQKILAAVKRIKERGKTVAHGEIAKEAGVHPGTVARLKDESDEVRKAIDSVLQLSAEQKILAAVKRIKEKGKTAIDREIAEEAGVHPGTLAKLKADSSAVRRAVEGVSTPPAKQKILAAVKRIKESGEKATQVEIAEEAGVVLHTLLQLKKFNPALREAIDEVLPRSVRAIQNAEQESIPVSYRKTLQSMRILMGLFSSNINQHVLDFRELDWYDLERGLYARREILDDIAALLEKIANSDKSLTWGVRKSIRSVWKKVMEIHEAFNEKVGSFVDELSRKKRNTFIGILTKLRRVKNLCATILEEETPPSGSIYGVFKHLCDNRVTSPEKALSGQEIVNGLEGISSFDSIKDDLRNLYLHLHLIEKDTTGGMGKDARHYVPERVRSKTDQILPILARFRGKDLLRPKKALLEKVYEEEIKPILVQSYDELKKKSERVRELFGENVVAGELDLDYEFQQFVESFRREQFLRGNEGVHKLLDWVPYEYRLTPFFWCNLQCPQCMYAGGPNRKERMSKRDMEKALHKCALLVDNPLIHISGGEVLIIKKDLIEMVKRFPIYSLTTNATMMTREEAREFVTALKEAYEEREGKESGKGFIIGISMDDFHAAQSGNYLDKVANLTEAVFDCYPDAPMGFIAMKENWKEAYAGLKSIFFKRGFTLTHVVEGQEGHFMLERISDGRKKKLILKTSTISRTGRAVYDLPDEDGKRTYFSEFEIEDTIKRLTFCPAPSNPVLGRISVNYEGNIAPFGIWIAEHAPLLFGNLLQENKVNMMRRLNKDPLFRSLLSLPEERLNLEYILKIAKEYDPNIVKNIQKGKPGTEKAFFYWLFSNPERKLYVTYRLLNECYKEGILKGESPYAGMSNDEIKALVREQAAELRAEFVRRKKIDFIDKYYRTRKGLTKSKSTEGRAFLPSETNDVVVVAERFLRGKPEARVLDLGAGNVKALSILSLYAQVKGDEIDPELFAEGKTCIDEFSRHGIVDKSRIDLTRGDFLKTEKGYFSRYDLIYTYWPFSPRGSEEGERLKKRLLAEMDPDAILVVNRASRDLHEDLSVEFEEVEFPGEGEDAHPHLRAYRLRRESYATGYEGTGFGREETGEEAAREEEPAKLDLRSLIDEHISRTFQYRRSTELIKKLPENIYVTIQPSAWLEKGEKKEDFIKEWRSELTLALEELLTNALEGRSSYYKDPVSEEVSRVRIETRIEDGSIILIVEDDGPGIPEEGMKNVKLLSENQPPDPDVSTKGRAGGFGLAVMFSAAKYFGGDIEIRTRREEDYKYKKGTTARLRIPAEVVHIPSAEEVKSDNMLEKIKVEQRGSGAEWEKGIVKDFCDIVMARLLETAGKEKKQNIIIGIDTSWIPFDQNSGKVDALLHEVKKKFKLLTKMNAGEVMIVSESGDKLAERIDAVANDEKTKTDYSNVAILGSSVTLNSTEFDKFADKALLIEVEAGYFSLEMLTLALKMLAGYPDPETHDIAVIQDEKKGPRYYYFKAEPVDPDELLDKYELQTRLLEKHA